MLLNTGSTLYLSLLSISIPTTGKCAENVSIFDCVTSNRIDTRGKGRKFHTNRWSQIETMGKQKTRKFAAMKRMINLKDHRIKEKDRAKAKEKKKKDPSELKEREVTKYPSCLFFQYNTQLGPPYHVLVDTNFINFSIKAKLDIVQSMMDCLYAKCIPCITDCVMAEIEKLGMKYRVALRIAKDPRFERLPCTHKGTYADDCLVQRVTQHKCYILATVDRDLKRRIRKIPGVPIMYISNHRYNIERMPDDYGAPRF
ncbi:rRNA-processing protein FCF1 homolog [Sander lucioperca]|uniref:rRNA-processing protein FCF1 homolog n=3 Tax=Percidae TaxID=8165 RepID=A0A8C9XSA1_SANLU|nr:rRNA-processing protein FCF1 homolog [Sander lucioperca]